MTQSVRQEERKQLYNNVSLLVSELEKMLFRFMFNIKTQHEDFLFK